MNRNIVSGTLLILLSVIVNFPSPYPILYHNRPVYAHNFSITDDSTIEHAKNAANLSNALNDKLQGRIVDITQAYTNGLYNSTTLALVVANLVDEILRNYGSAYGITYDLTNMSNMVMVMMLNDNDSSSSGHSSMLEKNNAVLVNIYNYQTAQVLSNVVSRLF